MEENYIKRTFHAIATYDSFPVSPILDHMLKGMAILALTAEADTG